MTFTTNAGARPEPITVVLLKSLWPILADLAVFSVLFVFAGRGGLLDASNWPGTALANCNPGDIVCLSANRVRLNVTIVVLASALFPLANTYGYINEVMRAANSGRRLNRT